jgi:hypothetical protein
VDVLPVLHALALNEDLWNIQPLRTTYPQSPHHEADDILLWFNDLNQGPVYAADDKAVVPYPAWDRLPQVRPIIFDLMRRVEGVQLGRVMITRLKPGGQIYPHEDAGAPAEFYSRYQFCLQASPGCLFHCGDETAYFAPGSIWYFDNQQTHAVVNNGSDERISVVIDIRNG